MQLDCAARARVSSVQLELVGEVVHCVQLDCAARVQLDVCRVELLVGEEEGARCTTHHYSASPQAGRLHQLQHTTPAHTATYTRYFPHQLTSIGIRGSDQLCQNI